jgi:opacity protein-like surface antigen
MKLKTLFAAIAALFVASAAQAADVYSSNGGLKDAPGAWSLGGWYGEFSIGGAFSQTDVANVTTLSSDGAIFVTRVGYDQSNIIGRIGIGAYAEGSDNFDVNGKADLGQAIKFSQEWAWGAGGKLFYDHGNGQAYLLFGYAGTNQQAAGITKTENGYEWGGGINLKVTKYTYVKLEIDQIRYTDGSTFLAAMPVKGQVDDRFLVGIGFSTGTPRSSF